MKTVDRRLPVAERRSVTPRLKEAATVYGTPEHREWALAVKKRGRWKCAVCGDQTSRLYADHIVEVSDGGSATDVKNGQVLCPVHHGEKTARERAKRAVDSGISNRW